MIEIGGHQFRTLSQPIYLGDGRRICRVYANDKQVYPEIGNPNLVKIRGRRTIHASHSHDGVKAEELYGIGRPNTLKSGVDGYFACGPHSFDITVSFSAVLKSSYSGMFTVRTNGTFQTTDYTNYANHLDPLDMNFGSWWVGRVIDYYNETGSWDTPNTAYNYSPVPLQTYYRMCCPLFGTEPALCSNYIKTPVVNGSYSNNSFIDADILVSIQMSTPHVCGPIVVGEIWKDAFLGYTSVCGKCYQDRMSFPEFPANNGIHRVHAIVNCNPNNVSNGYPNSSQYFLANENFRPHFSSQPAIGNGHVTCGFPSFSYKYKSGSRTYTEAHIRYLRIAGAATDVSMRLEFPDWGAHYNWIEDLSSNHSGMYYGITLCEVPIEEFLYVGTYNNAPVEHREPQLSELFY